jgi:hypothetical protein
MDDRIPDRLLEALSDLDDVADEVTAHEAAAALDEATLQVFWRQWPRVGAWAGALWREINQDLMAPASPHDDPDLDEVGGESG